LKLQQPRLTDKVRAQASSPDFQAERGRRPAARTFRQSEGAGQQPRLTDRVKVQAKQKYWQKIDWYCIQYTITTAFAAE